MLTLNDYLTSSGKYPERANHVECTPEIKDKALDLMTKVNSCLLELGIHNAKASSGFRPSDVNKKTKNAAGKSNHMDADAIDLEGPQLGKMLQADYEKKKENSLLVKHGLYLEHPNYTKSWTHLQDEAPKSGKRVFIPYPGKPK
jgi:hypothetical protein